MDQNRMGREITLQNSNVPNNLSQLVLLGKKLARNRKRREKKKRDEGARSSIHRTPQRTDFTANEKGLLPEIGSKPLKTAQPGSDRS
jgi:hypothetical protein